MRKTLSNIKYAVGVPGGRPGLLVTATRKFADYQQGIAQGMQHLKLHQATDVHSERRTQVRELDKKVALAERKVRNV